MNARTATLFLGAMLSAGTILASAQAPATTPTDTQTTAPAAHGHHRHHGGNPDQQIIRLQKKLNLSDDQVTQLKPIFADRAQQMKALHADTTLSPADRKTKAIGIMQDSKTKIEGVLNDQQKQQFEQMLSARRSHHKGAPAQTVQPGL